MTKIGRLIRTLEVKDKKTIGLTIEVLKKINDDYIALDSNKQDKVDGVGDVEIGYLEGLGGSVQTQIDSKAPLSNPTFDGAVTSEAIQIEMAVSGSSGLVLSNITSTDGINTATLTNSPVVGNPSYWITIVTNDVEAVIPAWSLE